MFSDALWNKCSYAFSISRENWNFCLQLTVDTLNILFEMQPFGQFCDSVKQYVVRNKQNAERSHFWGHSVYLLQTPSRLSGRWNTKLKEDKRL